MFWRSPIDSRVPTRSPATLAVWTVYSPASQHGVFSARLVDAKKAKTPMIKLTGVFVLATSYSRTAFRRTTIGAAAFHFRVRNGNGWCHHANVTRAEKRLRCSALVCDSRLFESLVDSRFSVHDSDFQRAVDPLTSTYRKKNVIRDSLHCYIGFSDSRLNVSTIHATSRASFCFEIFPLLCLPSRLRGMG